MGWNGDISRMGKLAANLGRLASVPARASKVVAAKIEGLIREEFAAQADPYGNAWKPLAPATIERHGEHPILQLSGSMYGSLDVSPMRGAGVAVTIDHPSEDHQTGWHGPVGDGPARPILPHNTMPARWTEAIKASVSQAVNETMRGTG